jgi:hypothetical protein
MRKPGENRFADDLEREEGIVSKKIKEEAFSEKKVRSHDRRNLIE